MAVVISNETGLDLVVQILPRGEDGVVVKAFHGRAPAAPKDGYQDTLKNGENITLLEKPADTKVYHDLRHLGFKLKVKIERGIARTNDGDRLEAVILTFSLPN